MYVVACFEKVTDPETWLNLDRNFKRLLLQNMMHIWKVWFENANFDFQLQVFLLSDLGLVLSRTLLSLLLFLSMFHNLAYTS